MCCLTRDQIAALAAHDHIDPVSAAGLGEYLMHLHHGPQQVQQMICNDISAALHGGNIDTAKALYATLKEFLAQHPEALRGNT
jgi:hypothetical protein